MNVKMLIIAVYFVFVTSLSYAGGDVVGNGCGSRVCRDQTGKIFVAEVFDLTEARYLQGLKPNYAGLLGKGTLRINQIIIDKLNYLSPQRAKNIELSLNQFHRFFEFSNQDLSRTWDVGSLLALNTCNYEQVAVQKKINNSIKYYINREIWSSLNDLNRSALMFHEVLYTEALKAGAHNSIGVRKLNAQLFSEDFLLLDRFDFFRILIESGFSIEWGRTFWKANRIAGGGYRLDPINPIFPIYLEDTKIKIAPEANEIVSIFLDSRFNIKSIEIQKKN